MIIVVLVYEKLLRNNWYLLTEEFFEEWVIALARNDVVHKENLIL